MVRRWRLWRLENAEADLADCKTRQHDFERLGVSRGRLEADREASRLERKIDRLRRALPEDSNQ